MKFCGDNVSHELSLSFDVVAGPFLGRPFPTAAGLPSSVPVGRLRPHLLMQHTALGFAQAAERRQKRDHTLLIVQSCSAAAPQLSDA